MTNPNPGASARYSLRNHSKQKSVSLRQLDAIYSYIMLVEDGKDTKEAYEETCVILGLTAS
jgi:hypothetical protein